MSLARTIAYAVFRLEREGIPAFKTILHKVAYLALLQDRDTLYRPYFYGPFSDQVQNTIQSLLKSGFITPDPRQFHLDIERLRQQDLDPDTMLQEKFVQQNIDAVIRYLKSHDLATVDGASNLSKIHYLSVRIGYQADDVIQNIKHRSQFLGWSGIAGMDDVQVNKLYQLALALERQLAVNR